MNSALSRFKVVGQLGRGGMAEVYICRLQGIGGFEKEVVVKRIVPERAEDPEFVKMFLDEARVGANLNHPNIVQIFEIGEDDGVPYIAMEYVKGVTLAMVIRQLHRNKKGIFHYGHAARIIAGICEGLDYAHNAHDANGEPLRLVHRDVSPANIVISREGVPKLLDFGVAKAAGRLSQTHAGTIKGKIAYMAPEQVGQGELDHRADIFSLGVCLYELTVGRNPFKGTDLNEVAVLKNVIHGVFQKPSEVVPDYPKDLEQIVLQAMAHDVPRRLVSARDLRDRLETFIAQPQYASNNRAVATWLREVFTDFNNLTTTGTMSAFTGTPAGTGRDGRVLFGSQNAPSSPTPSSATRQLRGTSSGFPGAVDEQASGTGLPQLTPKSSNAWKWAGLSIAVLALAGVWWNSMRPQPVAPVAPAPVPIAPTTSTASDDDSARIYLDGAETLAKEKRFELASEVFAKATKLQIKSADLNIRMARVSDMIIMGGILKKASSLVKERDWRGAIDASKAALDRDSENAEAIKILTAARAGLQPSDVERPNKARERGRDGTITITTTPSGMVYIDDEPVGRAPLARRAITVGFHTVQVRAQGRVPSTQRIRVNPGQAVSLNVSLPMAGRSTSDDDSVMPFHLPSPSAKATPSPSASPTESPPAPSMEGSSAAAGSSSATIAARMGTTSSTGFGQSGHAPSSGSPAPAPTRAPPSEPTAAPTEPSTAPLATKPALPPPSSATAPAPRRSGPVVSAMPKSPVPRPTLPREPVAKSPEQVAQVCQLVESAVISLAGVSPEFARGITGPLRRSLGSGGQMYGVAMYYFIVREASLQHDSKTAAESLASAQTNGFLLRLKGLPANDRGL